MENIGTYIIWPFGIFYGCWVYFMAIWYILWSLGKFFQLWYVAPRKIWQPWYTVSDDPFSFQTVGRLHSLYYQHIMVNLGYRSLLFSKYVRMYVYMHECMNEYL
jgi:hypothetical protein